MGIRLSLLLACLVLLGSTTEARAGEGDSFAGVKTCTRCHATTTDAWQRSPHGLHGRMRADAPKDAVAAVGGHWMQAYLRRDKTGHHRIMKMCRNLRNDRWVAVRSVLEQLRGTTIDGSAFPEIDDTSFELHCAGCHSSQSRLRRDLKTGRMDADLGDSSVNCESCHGPGAKHARAWGKLKSDAPLTRLSALSPRRRNAVCARCHGGQQGAGDFGPDDTRGFLAILLDQDGLFPDGSASGQFYQYTGFSRSPCYLVGKLTCTGCHDSHGPRLRHRQHKDALCTRCHEEMATRAHTHHEPRGDGARCVGCHMPKLLKGFVKHQRDHRISSPVPSSPHVPDACTACHKDRDKSWADKAYRKWWGKPPRATLQAIEGMVWARAGDARAAARLRLMLKHRDPFFRANAAAYLRDPLAVRDDPVAEVRLVAAQSAKGAAAMIFLGDKEPIVRAAAMIALISGGRPVDRLWRPDLELSTRHKRNQPVIHILLGMLDLKRGHARRAEARFQDALAWRPDSLDAWHGLAKSLSASDRPAQARLAHGMRASLLMDLLRPRPWETGLAIAAAKALDQAGQREDARRLLRGVHSSAVSPEARRRIGTMLKTLGSER